MKQLDDLLARIPRAVSEVPRAREGPQAKAENGAAAGPLPLSSQLPPLWAGRCAACQSFAIRPVQREEPQTAAYYFKKQDIAVLFEGPHYLPEAKNCARTMKPCGYS